MRLNSILSGVCQSFVAVECLLSPIVFREKKNGTSLLGVLKDWKTYRIRFHDTIASGRDALSGIPSKSGSLINIPTKTVTKRVLPDFYLMESIGASMRCEDERLPAKRTASAKMCIIGIEMEKKHFKKRPLNLT
ncbi:hypothetical protein HW555_012802 [Spodoptera exigua]|uniref:Uncharacterized protein n=1 Tax=Spodoptera exigua TaxID=7107 RepID=A0A835KYQ4_SPOEX|nr:hypothetical protein HW555_012802 [Spodoptera exigua]